MQGMANPCPIEEQFDRPQYGRLERAVQKAVDRALTFLTRVELMMLLSIFSVRSRFMFPFCRWYKLHGRDVSRPAA